MIYWKRAIMLNVRQIYYTEFEGEVKGKDL